MGDLNHSEYLSDLTVTAHDDNPLNPMPCEQSVKEKARTGKHEFLKACKGKGTIGIQRAMQDLHPEAINMRDKNGVSGLNWACFFNNLSIVKALIECERIDINLPDNDGNTPLMTAAQAGHGEIVRYIITSMRKHVHVDAENHSGFTALMKAALNGKSNCARILLIAGADVTKRDWGKGLRAEEWARICGMHETANIIRNVSECTLTEEQKKELNWERQKRHPILEFFTATGKYIRRRLGWDGQHWITEAGSLYHLASHSSTLHSGIIAMVFTTDSRPTRNPHCSLNHMDSSMSCISASSQGEDTILIETTYANGDHSGSPKQTITQHCYETPKLQGREKIHTNSKSWKVPDLQLITASPTKQRKKQPKTLPDRNLLLVPTRTKKKKCAD